MAGKKYDFVIVGAGFAGATCARLLTDKGYKCLIIEERPFVGGNCLDMFNNGMLIQVFGAHIIHTNDEEVWRFLDIYGNLKNFYPETKMYSNHKLYTYPPNIETLREFYKCLWPSSAKQALDSATTKPDSINNIEDFCLANYGKDIYEKLFKNYFKKKLGRECKDLLVDNLENKSKMSFVGGHKMYSEKYQGIPTVGYSKCVENIIGDDIDIMLNTNFLSNKEKYMGYGEYVIYTGEIDKFFGYCIGNLDWASSSFSFQESESNDTNTTGYPMIMYADDSVGWHRTTEHKWLNDQNSAVIESVSTVTYEIYKEWQRGEDVIYPILTSDSVALYNRYVKKIIENYPKVLLCGRKPRYNLWHIADVVRDAMNLANKFEYKE